MHPALISAVQLVGPAAIGLAVAHYLRPVLRRLLVDICGTADRADFWQRITTVLMALAPLALVLVAGGSPLRCAAADTFCAAAILRRSLTWTLIGVIVSVGFVARAVWRQIPPQAAPAAPVDGSA